MRFLLLLLFVGSMSNFHAQSDTLNQVDEEGKKQGHWIYYGKDLPEKGYPAEGIIERGNYLNDRKHGWWYRYYNDGKTIKLKGQYKNNRPNGNFFKYYPDGTLKEEGTFTKGKYNGTHKRYYENGIILSHRNYSEKGIEVGESIYYFQNGCKQATNFHDSSGIQSMRVTYYSDSCGVSRDTLLFKKRDHFNPKPPKPRSLPKADPKDSWRNKKEYKTAYSDESVCQGDYEYRKMYDENDEILYDGNCIDGKVKTGKFYFYDSDGILVRIEI